MAGRASPPLTAAPVARRWAADGRTLDASVALRTLAQAECMLGGGADSRS
eukprot:SAG22_NODE_21862_length_253_cov_0.902597_1_plen_49_part_10